jgi:hypothetical protein
MDETLDQPLVFAHKVIRQIVQHMVAEDMVIEPEDYLAMRSVFRRCSGSWEQLGLGDQVHIELLKAIITAWGQMPGRVKESDRLV